MNQQRGRSTCETNFDLPSDIKTHLSNTLDNITRLPFRRMSNKVAILLVFFLYMTLLVFVISSDIRTTQRFSSPLVGFRHGKENRSTMDIVYSCLSTMAISSIYVMHFNVPSTKPASGSSEFLHFPTNKWLKVVSGLD